MSVSLPAANTSAEHDSQDALFSDESDNRQSDVDAALLGQSIVVGLPNREAEACEGSSDVQEVPYEEFRKNTSKYTHVISSDNSDSKLA